MTTATNNNKMSLSLLDLAIENEAAGTQMFAESKINPGKIWIHLSHNAIANPQAFVDSIFRFAEAMTTKPHIAQGFSMTEPQSHVQTTTAHPSDADLETLDKRIIEVLETISEETITKGADAFANFCKEMPEKLRLFNENLHLIQEESFTPAYGPETVIQAMQTQWDEALTPQEKALLLRCQTAKQIAERFIPTIIAGIEADPVVTQRDARVLEKIIEERESTGFKSFDTERSYTLKRATHTVLLVMASIAHLNRVR